MLFFPMIRNLWEDKVDEKNEYLVDTFDRSCCIIRLLQEFHRSGKKISGRRGSNRSFFIRSNIFDP